MQVSEKLHILHRFGDFFSYRQHNVTVHRIILKKYIKNEVSLQGYVIASIKSVPMTKLHGLLELPDFINSTSGHLLLLQKSLITQFTGAN